jgi:hypothetical protein
VLVIIAGIIVLAALLRTKRRAEAIAPTALIAKLQKAEDDAARLQGASVLAEELLIRLNNALRRKPDDGALG